jgi:hypothetical protein
MKTIEAFFDDLVDFADLFLTLLGLGLRFASSFLLFLSAFLLDKAALISLILIATILYACRRVWLWIRMWLIVLPLFYVVYYWHRIGMRASKDVASSQAKKTAKRLVSKQR